MNRWRASDDGTHQTKKTVRKGWQSETVNRPAADIWSFDVCRQVSRTQVLPQTAPLSSPRLSFSLHISLTCPHDLHVRVNIIKKYTHLYACIQNVCMPLMIYVFAHVQMYVKKFARHSGHRTLAALRSTFRPHLLIPFLFLSFSSSLSLLIFLCFRSAFSISSSSLFPHFFGPPLLPACSSTAFTIIISSQST